VVAVQNLAARDDRAGVVEVGVEVHEARSSDHALGDPPCELLERSEILLYKARAHKEVLGRVAGDGKLREGDQLRPRFGSPLQGVGHLLDVAPDVAHGGVDLGQPNPHGLNISRRMGTCRTPFLWRGLVRSASSRPRGGRSEVVYGFAGEQRGRI
jgi:hypothetical protein